MEKEQRLRETIIWLAGLLSTDGSVSRSSRTKAGVRYRIMSTEKEWLKQVADKLSEVEIKSGVEPRKRKVRSTKFIPYSPRNPYGYCLNIFEPYRITLLLRKYAQGFMMNRKWRRVLSAYPGGKKFTRWTDEENKFLIEHYQIMSYAEIGRCLGRSGVHKHVIDLRKKGVLPKDDMRLIRYKTRKRRLDGTFM